jgi:hypothetical protein
MKRYYVYRIDDPVSNQFYFGSRTCECAIEDDLYMGSMKTWKPDDPTRLVKTILKSNFRKRETAIMYEATLIKKYINDPLNENYHIPSVGFYGGFDGKTHTNLSKMNISSKLRNMYKLNPRFGERNGMFNKSHTYAAIEKMKVSATGRYTEQWYIDRYGELGIELYKDRCELIKYNSTGNRNPMYGKKHKNVTKQKIKEKNQKLVAKYNLKNEIITIYNSMSFAAMDNSISVSSISAVCNPLRINKTAGGYIWKFIEN